MKNIYTALLISILFFSLKCNAQNHSSLISEYSHIRDKHVIKINFEYDNKNRLIKKISNSYDINELGESINLNEAEAQIVSYDYYQDSIVSHPNGVWCKIVLNKSNLFEKEVTVNEFSKTKALTSRLTNTYNIDGFLIKEVIFNDYITYNSSSTYEYEYLNGNLAKETTTNRSVNPDGAVWENSGFLEYEYFDDKPNSLANSNFGKEYLGKSSKNLVKKLKNNNGYVAYYEYEFDQKGNVTKRTFIRIADGVKMDEEHYKYQ